MLATMPISIKFAVIIVMVLITHKEYSTIRNATGHSWLDIFGAFVGVALFSYLAGGLLHTTLLELLTEFHEGIKT